MKSESLAPFPATHLGNELRALSAAIESPHARPVRTASTAHEIEDLLEASNGPGTMDFESYMERRLLPLTNFEFNLNDARYIGHMTGPMPHYMPSIAANNIAVNSNVVKVETSNSFTRLERHVAAQVHSYFFQAPIPKQAVYDPSKTYGIFTVGGTAANETAIWLAKNTLLDDARSDVKCSLDGLSAALQSRGYKGARIITSSLGHYSMSKIADIIGIGERGLIQVSVDASGQMSLPGLEAAISECRRQQHAVLAVVALAGATETGSIDDLKSIGTLCAREGIHFHVDAAFGGALRFSANHGQLLDGIENAATITLCAHKALRCPLGLSAVIIRDPAQAATIEKSSRYIIRSGSADLGRRSAEGSRPANVVYLDARLQIDGPKKIGEEIDYSIALTKNLAQTIVTRPEFQLIGTPTMQILNYVYLPSHCRHTGLTSENSAEISAFTRKIQESLMRSFVSRTTLSHVADFSVDVFRVVLLNPETGPAALDEMLDDQVNLGAILEASNHANYEE